MTATSAPEQPFDGQGLGDGQLDAALGSALADWRSQGADTDGISAGLGDLGGLTLGDTSGTHITIDRDAAGWGWDVDGGRMDLASVVRHEVGHALGLGHSGSGLMEESLAPGQSLSVSSAPELPQSSQSDPAPESATPSSTDASATDQSDDQAADPASGDPASGTPSSDTPAAAAQTGTGDQQGGTSQPQGSTGATQPPAAPQAHWTVSGGQATLASDGALKGRLTYVVGSNELNFVGADGRTAVLQLAGITRLAVQGGAGDDAVVVDLHGAPTGLHLGLQGGAGVDSLTVAGQSTRSSYRTVGGGLQIVRDGVTFDAQDFEEVLDEASGMLSVNGDGGTLTVGGTAGAPTAVRGLLGQLVMLFGAPLVSALFDAGDGDLVVDGKLLWADNATRLVLAGRNVTLTPGSSIDTGAGDIDLRAHDTADADHRDASASIVVTGASISGGTLTISAVSDGTYSASGENAAVQGSSTATVVVTDSVLSALGGISLVSSSTVNGSATALGSAAHTYAARDAATATVLLGSTSIARITGSSSVVTGGLLSLLAANRTDATALADASMAGAGAGIARVGVDRITRAGIEGGTTVIARGLSVLARALGTVTVTSRSSRRGATGNDLSTSAMTSGLARTTSGAVPVAAALSFGRLAGVTEAYLDSGQAGLLRVTTSGAQGVSASGDGSVQTDATSYDGTGAAAAVTLSDQTTRARLGGRLQLIAPSVTVLADNDGVSIGSHARSGRGPASQVGALAVGIARTLTASLLDRGARLVSSGGTTDVAFRSDSTGRSTAGADGTKASSLVVLVVDHATDSVVGDDSDLVAPHDASIVARTDDDARADATGDAGSAITLSTVSTRALLGSGPALEGTGNLLLSADQTAAARTTGSLVALTFARHTTTVRSDRDVTMAGGAQFSSTGRSTTWARTLPTLASSPVLAAAMLAVLRSLADEVAVAHGATGSGWAQLPETGVAPVGSVAINAVEASTTATLPEGVAIVVGGPLGVPVSQVLSSAATAGSAGGSGAAADRLSVAVNLVRRTVIAVVSRDVHSSGDLTVRASRGPPADGSEHSAAAPQASGSTVLDLVSSTIRTTVGGTTTDSDPQTPAFTPPAGSVLLGSNGGTVRLGAATLIFRPGALAGRPGSWSAPTQRPAPVSSPSPTSSTCWPSTPRQAHRSPPSPWHPSSPSPSAAPLAPRPSGTSTRSPVRSGSRRPRRTAWSVRRCRTSAPTSSDRPARTCSPRSPRCSPTSRPAR